MILILILKNKLVPIGMYQWHANSWLTQMKAKSFKCWLSVLLHFSVLGSKGWGGGDFYSLPLSYPSSDSTPREVPRALEL